MPHSDLLYKSALHFALGKLQQEMKRIPAACNLIKHFQ